MPSRLKRFHESKQSHFITFTCYHRTPNLVTDATREVCLTALENSRQRYGFRVYGFVFMPEHVHILMSEPERGTIANAIQSFKIASSRRCSELLKSSVPFWQKRYYDRNVRDHEEFMEKVRYIHRNPVKRGLCEKPEDWRWSSFNHYATGESCDIEIESEWTARRRERASPPH